MSNNSGDFAAPGCGDAVIALSGQYNVDKWQTFLTGYDNPDIGKTFWF